MNSETVFFKTVCMLRGMHMYRVMKGKGKCMILCSLTQCITGTWQVSASNVKK